MNIECDLNVLFVYFCAFAFFIYFVVARFFPYIFAKLGLEMSLFVCYDLFSCEFEVN